MIHILENNELEFVKLEYPEFITITDENRGLVRNPKNYYRILDAEEQSSSSDNEVLIIKPKYFEERLKSTSDFNKLLLDWLKLNNKSEEY